MIDEICDRKSMIFWDTCVQRKKENCMISLPGSWIEYNKELTSADEKRVKGHIQEYTISRATGARFIFSSRSAVKRGQREIEKEEKRTKSGR